MEPKKRKKIPVEFIEDITKSIQSIKDDFSNKVASLEKKFKDLEDSGVKQPYVLDPYYINRVASCSFASELRGAVPPDESRKFARELDVICQKYKITSVSLKYINK